jgi:exopolyphosphatase/guanosine-5'-triphosphate,3'-diphosphate pyrophosphatase
VMGIAAIVVTTLGGWLSLRSLVVPGVGVREGVLLELLAAQYSPPEPAEAREEARVLLNGARWFARRLQYDMKHAEQVRRLAVSLFDQFRPMHRLEPDLRLVLELAAVMHDVGHFVSRKSHHRHGEYLVRNGEIPGLGGWRRNMVACLVRYHNSKSDPQSDHKAYEALETRRRRQVRVLTSFLRLAEKLASDHQEAVQQVEVDVDGRNATFRIQVRSGTHLDLAGLARKAGLFEREFRLKAAFRRAQLKEKVA